MEYDKIKEQYETFVNFVDYNIKIDIKNEKII